MGPRPRPSNRASPSVVDRGAVSPEACPQSPSASCGILEVPAGPRLVAEPAARSPTDLLFLQVGALGPFQAGTRVFPDPGKAGRLSQRSSYPESLPVANGSGALGDRRAGG